MIAISEGLEIPDEEVVFVASRSGGPGGQNVNKVSSRVTLRFDLDHSNALTSEQRERIRSKLAARINKDGILQVTSQRSRSQELNRVDTIRRFAELLRSALRKETPRIRTRATRASQEDRLEKKRQRTAIKRARSRKEWDD
jgi:ribosome-associated protein